MLETNLGYINIRQIVKVTKPYKVEEYKGKYAFDIILSNNNIERNIYETLSECEQQVKKVLSIILEEL